MLDSEVKFNVIHQIFLITTTFVGVKVNYIDKIDPTLIKRVFIGKSL